MTLKEMCEQVAVYTDRRDDFVTITGDNGKQIYDPEDDPGIWYEAMRASINSAYREVARKLLMPDMRMPVNLGDNGTIDLMYMSPGVQAVIAVFNEDGTAARQFDFETKYRIRIRNGKKDELVQLQYNYVPEPLENFNDEPEFPESLVDPMVYISRAAADLWMMERKTQPAQMWEARYYGMLGSIRSDMRGGSLRKIPKSRFR